MNIVFDLDGTLIDSAPDIQLVAATVLQRRGKRALTLEETRRFIGEGAAVFVQRMMSARGITETPAEHQRLYSEFLALYEFAVDKAVFYPGVPEALTALRGDGHRLAVCTNKPEAAARAVLRHMRITQFFAGFTAAGMVPARKPDPSMLHDAIRQLGGGPSIYVGDSETDAETALRASVPFALFTGGYRKTPVDELRCDWAFDHFSALVELVARQG